MGEPRGAEPATGSRPSLASAHAKLSPAQEAYGAWATHRLACAACRDIDRACDESDRLYRAWREQAESALGQLAAPGDSVPEGH